MKNPKFSIFKDKSGQFRFNLTARNGQIILQSEGYKSKAGCKNGIESVKTNATIDSRYDRKKAKNGQHYFVLLAGNKEPIGRSEMYKSRSGMVNGIKSVMKNAPIAGIDEEWSRNEYAPADEKQAHIS